MDQICQKKVFPVENRKTEHRHWIPHIQVSVCTKFHFKQTTWNFGPKFAQNWVFIDESGESELCSNSAYLNYSRHQNSAKTDSFDF